MITEVHVYILAVIQGITEFLPISSSGHLMLTSQVLGWPDQGLLTDVAVHVGTLGAVMAYLWRDIVLMCTGLYDGVRGRKHPGQQVFLHMVIGSIPLLVVGYFIKEYIHLLRSVPVIAYATIGFGIVLWAVDKYTLTIVHTNHLSLKSVLFIGIMQCLAFIPGTSRSGITITAGRLLSMTRQQAARFSMILAMPAIAGAGTLSALDVIKTQGGLILDPSIWMAMGISFVTALGFIAFMMAWVRTSSFGIFVAYRLLLGGVLLVLYYGGFITL